MGVGRKAPPEVCGHWSHTVGGLQKWGLLWERFLRAKKYMLEQKNSGHVDLLTPSLSTK